MGGNGGLIDCVVATTEADVLAAVDVTGVAVKVVCGATQMLLITFPLMQGVQVLLATTPFAQTLHAVFPTAGLNEPELQGVHPAPSLVIVKPGLH
jgi:hypothetical protein